MAKTWVENTGPGARFIRGRLLQEGEGHFVDDGPLAQPSSSAIVHIDKNAVGSDTLTPVQMATLKSSTRGLRGMSKHFGANLGGGATFNVAAGSGTLNVDESHGYKRAAVAPFAGVRLCLVNRTPNTIAGWRMTVAVTETADASSNDACSQPVVLGTMYKQAAPAGTMNGHVPATFGSAATTPALVGSATAATYQFSDLTPMTSLQRTDVPGSLNHLLIVRVDSTGNAANVCAVQSAVAGANALQAPTAANRGRTLCVFGGTALAANPANSGIPGNASNRMFEVFPIFEYTQPVETVAHVDDSTGDMDAIVAGVYNNWGHRACADASTAALAFDYLNMCASSQDAATVWARYKELLAALMAAGLNVPDKLMIRPVSVNDNFAVANPETVLVRGRARAAEIVSTMLQVGRKAKDILFLPVYPSTTLTAAQDAKRREWNQWLDDFAKVNGARCMSVPGLFGPTVAGVQQWAVGKNFDDKHPNELSTDTDLAPAAAAWLLS